MNHLRSVVSRSIGFRSRNLFSPYIRFASTGHRNVAIVAHVDHGKTTLVDAVLRCATAGTDNATPALNARVMDSNDLERERGITILSKVTSMTYADTNINIVDTPGHSDFGGEVERVLSMVDGICLVVDATDGPMPQTKFVLSKALKMNLTPIVVINKVDRPTARIEEVENEVFDLFCSLDANDTQMEYTTLYASGKEGWAENAMPDWTDETRTKTMSPLLDTIIKDIPTPRIDPGPDFKMLVTIMESDTTVHLGKLLLTGRIYGGTCAPGQKVMVIKHTGEVLDGESTVVKMFKRVGTSRVEINEVEAGDIITLAGVADGKVADTILASNSADLTPIQGPVLDPPTISMMFSVNDSPFVGNPENSGGTKLTSQLLKDRLRKEAETNIAIRIYNESFSVDGRESVEVHGRGELQLGILIETMRREGFEISVSPPKALMKKSEDGKLLEPIEEVVIDVPDIHGGKTMEAVIARKGEMMDSVMSEDGLRSRLTFSIPSRGMIGLRGELTTMCRGDCIVNAVFLEYQLHRGKIGDIRKGVLIASAEGIATEYALTKLEARGELFIGPTEKVYMGMIVGEHSRSNDLEINVAITKKLTNVRAAGKDEYSRLQPPRKMNLENYLGYIAPDELVEVTPKAIRIRKSHLNPSLRKGPKASR